MNTLGRILLAAALLVAATGASAQTTFATPDEAARGLIAAVRAADAKAMLAILGAEAKPILSSGDAVADRRAREAFVKACDEGNRLDTSDPEKAVLRVGKDEWPFPVPIVKTASGWRFDAKAGREEVLNRRVGRNELAVIEVLGAYVDAQREYYVRNPQNAKLLQYAQRLRSTEGKRDGLYWPVKAGERPSPLGPLVSGARTEGYKAPEPGKLVPYHGYYYRILKAQGPDASGGAYSYLAQGRMIGGFGLIAWPATYGNSGVMTFIVNHDGVVYEKDLGKDTGALASKIARFNPDNTWKRQ